MKRVLIKPPALWFLTKTLLDFSEPFFFFFLTRPCPWALFKSVLAKNPKSSPSPWYQIELLILHLWWLSSWSAFGKNPVSPVKQEPPYPWCFPLAVFHPLTPSLCCLHWTWNWTQLLSCCVNPIVIILNKVFLAVLISIRKIFLLHRWQWPLVVSTLPWARTKRMM